MASAFYVHWPYCEIKCPYCDFNSHFTRNLLGKEQEYLKAILTEIEFYARFYGKCYLTSIYFGGGTPSLMSEKTIAEILNQIAKLYDLAPNIEITIEVNPNSYIRSKFKSYKIIGINRVSIGVQSFDNTALKMLGRAHNVVQAEQALSCAAELFANYSFDLIYARAEQNIKQWERELKHALSFNAPHMSLYELTIEPGTKFATLVNNGKLKVLDVTKAAKFYELTQNIMNQAQMPAYEVSNHAKEGYISSHNMAYWRYKEYIGVGPGAHSRIWLQNTPIILAQYNEKQPNLWQKNISEKGNAIIQSVSLNAKEQAEELMLNSMRIIQGLDIERFELLAGYRIDRIVIEDLVAKNLVRLTTKYLQPTQKGLLFVDYIVRRLLNL